MVKRFFYIFILIIVFLFFPLNVYASSESENEKYIDDPSGMDNWTFSEKLMYWDTNFFTIVDAVIKLPFGNSTEKMDELFTRFTQAHSNKYDSYAEMLATGTRYDDTTEEFTFDDLSLSFINFIKSSIEEERTFQYGYFCPVESIDPNSFDIKEEYDIIHNIIQSNPDYAFSVWKSGITLKDSNGNNMIYGAWNVKFFKVPYAGVGNTGGSITTSKTTVYNDNWESSIDTREFYIIANDIYNTYPPGGYDAGDIFYNNGSEFVGLHDVSLSDFDLNLCPESVNGYSVFLGISNNYFDNPVHPNQNYIFSSHAGGIPVFKSVADMKAGTTGKQVLQTLPGYTGQPITNNTISQKEINDFSTTYNYYYNSGNNPGGGGGSGSDPGSSGNWLDTLLGALGKLGDIIMTLLTKAFDIITDILKFFTDTLAGAMDIIPKNFIEFLGAFFPFIPKEWITAVSLAISLVLIGVIIKVLKNIF